MANGLRASSCRPARRRLAVALVWAGAVGSLGLQASPSAAEALRLAVCRLQGADLPQGGMLWLSALVREEAAKANSLAVAGDLLSCGDDAGSAAATARSVGADRVIAGRLARAGDLFVVELQLVSAATGVVERQESAQLVASPLDPRLAVRVATQRLLGIGGDGALPESTISVSSTPAGAKVYLGGLLEGRSPVRLRVPPGRHSITATHPGYSAWALDVDVKQGEVLALNASLTGGLSVTRSRSAGGHVLLGFVVPYAAVFGEGLLYLAHVNSGRPYLGWALVAPPAAYLVVADRLGDSDIDLGRSWAMVSSALWGAAWGVLGVGTAGLDSPRPYVALSMTSSSAGMVIASAVTRNQQVSRKRVSMVNTGGFMGSAIGLGIPYLLDAGRPRDYNIGLLSGGILGALVATHLTSGLDFVDRGE